MQGFEASAQLLAAYAAEFLEQMSKWDAFLILLRIIRPVQADFVPDLVISINLDSIAANCAAPRPFSLTNLGKTVIISLTWFYVPNSSPNLVCVCLPPLITKEYSGHWSSPI
jgi:hypothetical protein